MTKDDIYYLISVKKPFEFSFNGKNYNMTYGKDSAGKEYIDFGERYTTTKYYSFGELINNAKVENYFFKDLLEIL